MKNIVLWFIAFLGLPLLLPAALGQTPRVSAADVDLLLESIRQIHPDPFRLHEPTEYDSAAAALKARLPSLSPQAGALEIQRLLAMVGDGHTEWAALPTSLRGRWLPLVLRRFEEGWFVRTGDQQYRPLFGKPITAIAGVPMAHVVQRVLEYASGDNELGKLDTAGNLIRNVHVLEALGLANTASSEIAVTVLERNGSQTTLPVAVTDDGWVTAGWRDADKLLNPEVPEPLYRALDGNYACAWLPERRVLYVLFNEVRDDGEMSIAQFFERVGAFAQRQSPDKFVLDIRENSGGNLDLNGPILQTLIENPRLNRPGRTFVIVSPDTYSAAMNLAVSLERYTYAMFVGGPTGALPNHFGDTRIVELPDSGIQVEISELFWQNSDPRDKRPWITPDLVANPSAAALVAGRDRPLEAILTFQASDSLATEFGPPMSRWKRPSQLLEESWPALLDPAARSIDWAVEPSQPVAEACVLSAR